MALISLDQWLVCNKRFYKFVPCQKPAINQSLKEHHEREGRIRSTKNAGEIKVR